MNAKEEIENKIFFGKYKPEKKIGEGSFAININTNEKYALKLENRNNGQNLLESEAYVLCYLKGSGIPSVKSYGFSGDHNILVMELLWKSLEDLFQECGGKFTTKTVCMLADQMLHRIEYVHSKHIIHRDIKPDNFIMGINDNVSSVYVIDFGLAKKYRSSRNLQHIAFHNNKKLTGTARYASINALKGVEQSRRDDLEAIGYVLMYFLKGVLPWQGLKVDKREDRYKKIYEKKKNTTPEELCQGFPSEFCTYITYTRNLSFEQEPDYDYLRGLFRSVMSSNCLQYDYEFDWVKSKKKSITKTVINSRNVTNEIENKKMYTSNVSHQAVNTTENIYSNVLQTQNNVSVNIKKKLGDEKNDISNSHAMIHTQQNQESAINKPKNLIVNETNNKFIENKINKSKNLSHINTNIERTITQSAIINTQMNHSILQTQNNPFKKDRDNSKLNISANNILNMNNNSIIDPSNKYNLSKIKKSESVEKKQDNDSNNKKSKNGCLIY